VAGAKGLEQHANAYRKRSFVVWWNKDDLPVVPEQRTIAPRALGKETQWLTLAEELCGRQTGQRMGLHDSFDNGEPTG